MDNKFTTFDGQLFDYKDWRSEGPLSMQFAEVTLKTPIGSHEVGAKFAFAFLLGDLSLVVLVTDEGKEEAYRLSLSVGDKLDESELPKPPAAEAEHGDGCSCGHEHEG
jgi:hypothetical protein